MQQQRKAHADLRLCDRISGSACERRQFFCVRGLVQQVIQAVTEVVGIGELRPDHFCRRRDMVSAENNRMSMTLSPKRLKKKRRKKKGTGTQISYRLQIQYE